MLKVNEIYYSLQGESTKAGEPCIFVRLTYCNLRCSYCDTEYAFYEGKEMQLNDIISEIEKFDCNLVEITGGEPLVQSESLELMEKLCDMGYEVLLETGGSLPIKNVDKRVKIILDLKTPSSLMEQKNKYSNLDFIKPFDEIKFVIGNYEDYLWSKEIIINYNLSQKAIVLFSVVFGKLKPIQLTEWILKDNLKVKFQLQMHKYIWEPETKGV